MRAREEEKELRFALVLRAAFFVSKPFTILVVKAIETRGRFFLRNSYIS